MKKQTAEQKLWMNALQAARYWGAEFQANPGDARSEYLDSIAMKLGKEQWSDISRDQRTILLKAFHEGMSAERALQRR